MKKFISLTLSVVLIVISCVTTLITTSANAAAGYGYVVYNTNGGNTIENKQVEVGTTVTSADLSVPTKTNYEFLGWYTDTELTASFSQYTFATENENLNLYAAYKQKLVQDFEDSSTYKKNDDDFTTVTGTAGNEVHSGTTALKYNVTQIKNNRLVALSIKDKFVLKANTYYNVSLWVKVEAPTGENAVRIDLMKSQYTNSWVDGYEDNQPITTDIRTLPTGEWKQLTLRYIRSDDYCVGLTFNGSGTAIYFDDIVIEEELGSLAFDTNGGNVLENYPLTNNQTVTATDIANIKPVEDDTFIGWYEDADLTTPFESYTATTTVQKMLYAKYSVDFRENFESYTGSITAKATDLTSAGGSCNGGSMAWQPSASTRMAVLLGDRYSTAPLKANTTYKISIWVKLTTAAVKDLPLSISEMPDTRTNVWAHSTSTEGGLTQATIYKDTLHDWTEYTFEFTTTQNCWPKLLTYGQAGFYIDNITISTVPARITFNTNGGNKLEDIEYSTGTTVTANDIANVRPVEDSSFLGWYEDAALETPFTSYTFAVAETKTLYAKYNVLYRENFESYTGAITSKATDLTSAGGSCNGGSMAWQPSGGSGGTKMAVLLGDRYSTAPLKANTSYTISVWVKLTTAAVKDLPLSISEMPDTRTNVWAHSTSTEGGLTQATIVKGTLLNEWTEFSFNFTTTQDCWPKLLTYGQEGFYIDNITIVEYIPDLSSLNSVDVWKDVGNAQNAVYGEETTYVPKDWPSIESSTDKSHDDDGKSLKIHGYNGTPFVADIDTEADKYYKVSFWYCSDGVDTTYNSAIAVQILSKGSPFNILDNGIAVACNIGAYYSISGKGIRATDKISISPNPVTVSGIQPDIWYKFEMYFDSYSYDDLGLVIYSGPDTIQTLYIDEISVEEVTDVSNLKFDSKGGSAVASIKSSNGVLLKEFPVPTHPEELSFAGWYLEPEYKNKVNMISLTGDTTLYAKWLPKGHFEQPIDGYYFEGKEDKYKFGYYFNYDTLTVYDAKSDTDPNVHSGNSSIKYVYNADNPSTSKAFPLSIFDPTMGKLTLGEKYYISMYIKPVEITLNQLYIALKSVSSNTNAWADQNTILETTIHSDVLSEDRKSISELITGTTDVVKAEEPDENGWIKFTFTATATTDYFAFYFTNYGTAYIDDITVTPLPTGVIDTDFSKPYSNTLYNQLNKLSADVFTKASTTPAVYKIPAVKSRYTYVFTGEVTDAAAAKGAYLQLAWDENGKNLVEDTKITGSKKTVSLMTASDDNLYLVVYNPYGAGAFENVSFFDQRAALDEEPLANEGYIRYTDETLPELSDLLKSDAYAEIVADADFDSFYTGDSYEDDYSDSEGDAEGDNDLLTETDPENSDSPETGDYAMPILLCILTLISSMLLLGVSPKNKRRLQK